MDQTKALHLGCRGMIVASGGLLISLSVTNMSDPNYLPRTDTGRSSWPLPRFQFSLAKLMLVVTVVAIGLTLVVTIGGFLTSVFEAFVWCVLPTPLLICSIFGRNDTQAFAIGTLVPWFTMLTLHVPSGSTYMPATMWLLILGGVCGLVASATRRWVVTYGRD